MFNDSFKLRYTTIPFASYARIHKAKENGSFPTLSHKHREMEILVAQSGRALFRIDAVSYEVCAGDILMVPPYRLHHAILLPDADFSHCCICFDLAILHEEELQNSLESGSTAMPVILRANQPETSELAQYIRNTFRAHADQKDGWELCVRGNLCLFFSRLKEGGHLFSAGFSRNSDDICYRILDFIEMHHREPITSGDAAREFHLSNSYFCRMFRSNFGCCFQKYLGMFRVEKAKILLSTTGRTVSEIASAVGFANFSYFSRTFREYVSMSPSEYRKRFCGDPAVGSL